MTDKVYIVYGPSIEWADGQGVIGYASSYEDAEALLDEERNFIKTCFDEDEIPDLLDNLEDKAAIVEETVESVCADDEWLMDLYRKKGLDALVEKLNDIL